MLSGYGEKVDMETVIGAVVGFLGSLLGALIAIRSEERRERRGSLQEEREIVAAALGFLNDIHPGRRRVLLHPPLFSDPSEGESIISQYKVEVDRAEDRWRQVRDQLFRLYVSRATDTDVRQVIDNLATNIHNAIVSLTSLPTFAHSLH